MLTKLRHTLVALGLIVLISGCAIYPAVQVAGVAMTGYDAVNLAHKNMPRNSIESGHNGVTQDKVLERRLKERLKLDGQKSITARVIYSQAYLVGRVQNRAAADRAVKVGSSVQGLTVLNCKFYPTPNKRQTKADSRLLASLNKRLDEVEKLHGLDLSVDVISGNAILIGKAWTFDQKNAILRETSKTQGILEVIDYIVVKAQPRSTEG